MHDNRKDSDMQTPTVDTIDEIDHHVDDAVVQDTNKGMNNSEHTQNGGTLYVE